MPNHRTGTRDEWLEVRLGLLKAVYHTYSAYSRGIDSLGNMWQWLDRAPLGRNEGDLSWFRRHDHYEASYR